MGNELSDCLHGNNLYGNYRLLFNMAISIGDTQYEIRVSGFFSIMLAVAAIKLLFSMISSFYLHKINIKIQLIN